MHLLRSLTVSCHSISIYLAMQKIKQVLAYYTSVVSNCNQHRVISVVRTEFIQANNIIENLKKWGNLFFSARVSCPEGTLPQEWPWNAPKMGRFNDTPISCITVDSDTIRNYTKIETGWDLIKIFSFSHWSTCVSCWFSTLNMRLATRVTNSTLLLGKFIKYGALLIPHLHVE